MVTRTKQRVEVYVRGRWITTEAFVIPEDICRNPGCIRKIPNVQATSSLSRRGCPAGYCSKACFWKHKKQAHLHKKLDQYMRKGDLSA